MVMGFLEMTRALPPKCGAPAGLTTGAGMRVLVAIFGLMALMPLARADDIVDVLERSQRQRLEQRIAAPDGERSQRVRSSFDALLSKSSIAPRSVELRVMQGGV